MPCRYGTSPDHRVRVELVEADLEIGFSLVDLVESCPSQTARLVSDAEEIYQDVLARLQRLEDSERQSFEPIVAELRRAIDLTPPH
ncbi:MAG: hypothetical protein P4L56_14105 [Candidatus Sulfopaludibacter sp.]|nr:hypothetical protein [Candidatus Sulfopaludibacter sp.]